MYSPATTYYPISYCFQSYRRIKSCVLKRQFHHCMLRKVMKGKWARNGTPGYELTRIQTLWYNHYAQPICLWHFFSPASSPSASTTCAWALFSHSFCRSCDWRNAAKHNCGPEQTLNDLSHTDGIGYYHFCLFLTPPFSSLVHGLHLMNAPQSAPTGGSNSYSPSIITSSEGLDILYPSFTRLYYTTHLISCIVFSWYVCLTSRVSS